MTMFLISLLCLNSFIGFMIYKIFYKKRKLYDDRFGMIMAMSCSGILSLNLSMIVQFLFPENFSIVMIISVIVCGLIGVLFGSLVKFQSLLAGFFNGIVGGLMGNMLGLVIKDPSICSLPAAYLTNINQNMMLFGVFGTFLAGVTIFFVFYSLKV
ncbi:hypothetical protein [Bacillus dakarensis]|uniref:hypothetical protein n=1 Tax=Robertmurraya dakarensis TaxID=1926278 RepID=UPI0009809715|nr:hypothetical protein [Bacillus dakarensis]